MPRGQQHALSSIDFRYVRKRNTHKNHVTPNFSLDVLQLYHFRYSNNNNNSNKSTIMKFIQIQCWKLYNKFIN